MKLDPLNDFNSIKVRLKHRIAFEDWLGENEFQFHKGTIKTDSLSVEEIDIDISIP